jgi:hypothetical protein
MRPVKLFLKQELMKLHQPRPLEAILAFYLTQVGGLLHGAVIVHPENPFQGSLLIPSSQGNLEQLLVKVNIMTDDSVSPIHHMEQGSAGSQCRDACQLNHLFGDAVNRSCLS